jgi:hypothetical protein
MQQINTNEVAPVLIYNLLSVASEWSGFDEDWLLAATKRRSRRPTLMGSQTLWRCWIQKLLQRPLLELQLHFQEL